MIQFLSYLFFYFRSISLQTLIISIHFYDQWMPLWGLGRNALCGPGSSGSPVDQCRRCWRADKSFFFQFSAKSLKHRSFLKPKNRSNFELTNVRRVRWLVPKKPWGGGGFYLGSQAFNQVDPGLRARTSEKLRKKRLRNCGRTQKRLRNLYEIVHDIFISLWFMIFSFHNYHIPYIFHISRNQGRSPTGSWWEASPLRHCGICGVQIPRETCVFGVQFWKSRFVTQTFPLPMNAVQNGILAVVNIVDFRGLICYAACGAMLLPLQRQRDSSPKNLIQELRYCHDQLQLWFLIEFSSKYLQFYHGSVAEELEFRLFSSRKNRGGPRRAMWTSCDSLEKFHIFGGHCDKTKGQDMFKRLKTS